MNRSPHHRRCGSSPVSPCSWPAAARTAATRDPAPRRPRASGDPGRPRRRRRAAQRQRVQRARLRRAQAGRARARDRGPRRRGEVRRRLRPEHVHARAAGLRPRHRGRVRAGDAVAAAAAKYPDTNFAIVDVDQTPTEGQAGERRRGSSSARSRSATSSATSARSRRSAPAATSISAVGGFKEPPVDRFIAGYRAGAEAAVPGTKVRWGYSQDWDDQAKCKELALNQIAAGSKVVFQVAGGCGLGALSAAKDKGVWGIGVDGDQSFLGPHVLTSALKGVDAAVFLTIQAVVGRGLRRVAATRSSGSIRTASGSARPQPERERGRLAATEKVEQQIADGEITDIPTTSEAWSGSRGPSTLGASGARARSIGPGALRRLRGLRRPRPGPNARVRTEYTGGRCPATGDPARAGIAGAEHVARRRAEVQLERGAAPGRVERLAEHGEVGVARREARRRAGVQVAPASRVSHTRTAAAGVVRSSAPISGIT